MGINKSVHRILRKPRITEKGTIVGSVENSVVFEVHPLARKEEIKRAVEEIFEVKVKKVRTLNSQGKLKKVGQRSGYQNDWKKAYVSLQEGNAFDIIEGM